MSDMFPTEGGEGGLPELDGTISDFFFQDGDYGCSICVVNQFDDPVNYPRFPEGKYTQWYPLGSDFHAIDNGAAVEGPNKWNRNQDAGKLLYALGQVPGIQEALEGTGWTHTQAKSWIGLHLHWERESYEVRRYKRDAQGNKIQDPENPDKFLLEPVTKSIMLPVRLIGAQLSLPDTNGAGVDIDSLGLTAEQVTKLAIEAQASKSGAEFISGVVKVDAALMAGTPFAAAMTKDAEGVRQALAAAII